MEQCGFLQGALGSSLASSFLKSCKFSFQPIKHGLFSSLSLKVITIPFLLFSKTNEQRHFSKKGQSTNSLVETLNIYIYIYTLHMGSRVFIDMRAFENQTLRAQYFRIVLECRYVRTCIFIDETIPPTYIKLLDQKRNFCCA